MDVTRGQSDQAENVQSRCSRMLLSKGSTQLSPRYCSSCCVTETICYERGCYRPESHMRGIVEELEFGVLSVCASRPFYRQKVDVFSFASSAAMPACLPRLHPGRACPVACSGDRAADVGAEVCPAIRTSACACPLIICFVL